MEEASLARELIRPATVAVGNVAGEVWGLILGDRLAFYRRKNAMRLSKRLHEEAEKLGARIDTGRVPDQFAYEWGEAATKVSDETLQEMFVRLLTTAATQGGSTDQRLIYALREMAADDAVLFNYLYSDENFRDLWEEYWGIEAGEVISDANENLGIDGELALDNLSRMKLLREVTGLRDNKNSGLFDQTGEHSHVAFTTERFIRPSALGRLLFNQVAGDASSSKAAGGG